MGHTVAWETILPLFGAVTLVSGAVMAARQTDLKRMLAYTTLASLGLLVLLIGYGTAEAIAAATLYLVAHSLFKGALFMVAGMIDHEAGTRDITRLGGLRRAMPLTFAIALMAALSMAGLPPFFGFLAKEEIYAVFTRLDLWSVALLLAVILGNALMFAIAFAVGWKPFWGVMPKALADRHVHEAPFLLWAGPLVLALCGLAAALAAPLVHGWISSPMASSAAGEAVEVTISLIPHIGLPLALSVLTILLGVFILARLQSLRQVLQRLETTIGWGPDRGFDQAMAGLVRFSSWLTRRLQSGRLEAYVTITFITVAASLLVPMTLYAEWPQTPDWPADIRLHELAIFALAILGLVSVVMAGDRLTAIVALGIQGFAVAMIFLIFGAPDLAFTQFMVETLSVVILALVMTRLNLRPSDHRNLAERFKDGAIALACAVGFSAFLMRATQMSFDNRLTDFFNLYSRTIAHGANVVNVIIVDFRGTDTLGEIAVVMVTGLAILALIRIRVQTGRKLASNNPAETEEAP
jgi:multicomponent Na+:H+ antiporter subunit A